MRRPDLCTLHLARDYAAAVSVFVRLPEGADADDHEHQLHRTQAMTPTPSHETMMDLEAIRERAAKVRAVYGRDADVLASSDALFVAGLDVPVLIAEIERCYALMEQEEPDKAAIGEGGRLQTGIVQCDEDWPGVFIRGDEAQHLWITLDAWLDGSPDEASMILQRATLEGLRDLLTKANVHAENHERPQFVYRLRASKGTEKK